MKQNKKINKFLLGAAILAMAAAATACEPSDDYCVEPEHELAPQYEKPRFPPKPEYIRGER